jgi:hypothetical protein
VWKFTGKDLISLTFPEDFTADPELLDDSLAVSAFKLPFPSSCYFISLNSLCSFQIPCWMVILDWTCQRETFV